MCFSDETIPSQQAYYRKKTSLTTKMSMWLPQLEHEMHGLDLRFDSVAASVDETLS